MVDLWPLPFFFFFEASWASWASWSVWHCWKVLVGSSEYFSAFGSFMKHLKFNQVEHVGKKTRPGEIEIKMEKRRSFERGGQRSTIHWVLAFVFHLWFPGHFSTRKANSFILKHPVGMFWIAAVRNRWCSTAEAERVAKEALNNGELKPVKKNKHKNNKKKTFLFSFYSFWKEGPGQSADSWWLDPNLNSCNLLD